MIYPWYDEERWLRERFKGNSAEGRRLIREYGPSPAVVYFRHSYVSFRVKGFEYARLFLYGKTRYGLMHAPLEKNEISPKELICCLVEMFNMLAESASNKKQVSEWAQSQSNPSVVRFLLHAIKHHQREHWLESELLVQPELLDNTFVQVCSQVVVGNRQERVKPFQFIDLMALDPLNHLLWVIELKAVTATKKAVEQARDYVDWVNQNMIKLLDRQHGYFAVEGESSLYRAAVGFVAPNYSKDCGDILKCVLPGCSARYWKLNQDWQKRVKLEKL